MSPPLKIGLLVDGDSVQHWAAVIINHINASNCAQVTLVVKNTLPGEPAQIQERRHASPGSPAAFLLKLRRNASKLGYIAFSFFDSRISKLGHGIKGTPYDSEIALADLVPDVPVVEVTPRKTQHSDFIEGTDIDRVREADIDIFFRLGFRILRGEILNAARYGVWSYHHGDNEKMRGGPSGFWELSRNTSTVGVILQILNEDLDGGRVLARSWHLRDTFKLDRQRHNVFMQALSHFPRQVERLHRLGAEKYFAEVDRNNADPDFYSRRLFVAPTNRYAVWYIGTHYLRYLGAKVFQLFFFRQWILLACFKADGQLSQSMWRFKQILPPRDRVWADPFAIKRDGKYYVFIEEMLRGRGKGHISVMTIEPDGSYSDPVPVIECDYHMSYPFLLEHEGELYMIPETGDNLTVDAYRCVEFPYKWEHHATLMRDVFAVDATLHQHDDRWWMFVTITENEQTDCLDELHLFYADSPLSSNWTPHPDSPVSTDVRNARPGGAVLHYNNRHYRIAQNGGRRYGYGFSINLIEQLDENGYKESKVTSVEPKWDWTINATHTLNHADDLTVSDASKLRFRFFTGSNK